MTENKTHTLASALDFIASEIDSNDLDSFLETENRFVEAARNLDVDYILTGETAGFDKIVTLCNEESIRKEKTNKKIGF